jgi:hypothetical protein
MLPLILSLPKVTRSERKLIETVVHDKGFTSVPAEKLLDIVDAGSVTTLADTAILAIHRAEVRAPSGRAEANLWSPSARTSRNSSSGPEAQRL